MNYMEYRQQVHAPFSSIAVATVVQFQFTVLLKSFQLEKEILIRHQETPYYICYGNRMRFQIWTTFVCAYNSNISFLIG